jgi:hypothetical protein
MRRGENAIGARLWRRENALTTAIWIILLLVIVVAFAFTR